MSKPTSDKYTFQQQAQPKQDVLYKVNERKCKTASNSKFSSLHIFEETSKKRYKKRQKKKSGVTLVVIHLSICQLPMRCNQTTSMLWMILMLTSVVYFND